MRHAGGIRSANADISNDKAGEKPARRKTCLLYTSETREMVIERVLALDTAEFDLEDLKCVILMVLFNIPGCENAYQQMEELLFEVNEGMLH